jgi:predicted RNA-binding Zn ribbon-like protein
MATQVEALPMPAVVDLVNGWGTVPRRQAADREPAPIAQFRLRTGVSGVLGRDTTDADLQRVADLVFPVFAAASSADRARLVTELLARCGVRPALADARGAIRSAWLITHGRDALLAAAAVALHAQLVDHEPDRLGTCAAERCADAYVDASPAAHRRFCSVTCQNRTRVAVFRRKTIDRKL